MKILTTLDGSHFSESILGTVQTIAQASGAEVELFAVGRLQRAHDTPRRTQYEEMTPVATTTGSRLNVPLPSEQGMPPVETREQAIVRIETELQEYLTDRARDLEGVRTTIAVDVADDPAEAIIHRAREIGADLIAMATHGRSGLGHLLAGSVCEKVIRSGTAPVVVLRP